MKTQQQSASSAIRSSHSLPYSLTHSPVSLSQRTWGRWRQSRCAVSSHCHYHPPRPRRHPRRRQSSSRGLKSRGDNTWGRTWRRRRPEEGRIRRTVSANRKSSSHSTLDITVSKARSCTQARVVVHLCVNELPIKGYLLICKPGWNLTRINLYVDLLDRWQL